MLKSIALALAVALTPVAVSASESVPPDAPPYYDILVGTLHEDDRDAMEGWETDLRDRLGEIAAGPVDGQTAGWITEILEVIDAERLPIAEDTELLGHWQVRSMQADDLGAYV